MLGFDQLIQRYGQPVTLCYVDQEPVSLKAFFQLIRKETDHRWQVEPTALGYSDQDIYRYLGPADHSLAELGEGYVLWRGLAFEVTQVQPIYVGETLFHWWATLRRREY